MMISFRIPRAALVLMSAALCCGAGEIDTAFDAANKLYEQGKFADAAATYEKLLQSGVRSGSVHFNLGNASSTALRPARPTTSPRNMRRILL